MNNEEIYEILQSEYSNISNTEEIRKILKSINSANCTYKDLYEYANSMGESLGESLKKFLDTMDVEDVNNFVGILSKYSNDINEAGVTIQTMQNELNGIRLKGQNIAFNKKEAEFVLRDMVFMPNAEQILSHFGLKIVDEIIEKNADFLSKAGYGMVIVRKYDNVGLRRRTKWAETCDWCLERVGTFEYPPENYKVFERHEGCKCSIELKYDGTTEKVMNYKKKIKIGL